MKDDVDELWSLDKKMYVDDIVALSNEYQELVRAIKKLEHMVGDTLSVSLEVELRTFKESDSIGGRLKIHHNEAPFNYMKAGVHHILNSMVERRAEISSILEGVVE